MVQVFESSTLTNPKTNYWSLESPQASYGDPSVVILDKI